MVTAVTLLSLLNDKCKPELLQRDGRPGWRFPQTADCKARTCFVDMFNTFAQCVLNSSHDKKWCPCTAHQLRILVSFDDCDFSKALRKIDFTV